MHDQPSARLVCDRRRDTRDECAIDAEIRAGDERFPCRIRDISEGGARIDVPAGRDVPHAFTLDIPVLDQVVEPRACERRWRVADVVGLRFL